MEARQLHSSSDEEYKKKKLFFNHRNVPKRYLSHGCHLLHLRSTLNLLLEYEGRGVSRGKVIVSEREEDSFKSWGQEGSSASQGHRYFMALTFLHDNLMPRIERLVLRRGKKKVLLQSL